MNVAIDIEALHVGYGKSMVLWDLTLQIPKGVILGVLGPNGAGKSTLLKAMLGLVKPLSGRIELFGTASPQSRCKIAYVPQRESIDWDFPITAEELVLMGRFGRLGLFGRLRKADREAAAHALELVGMAAFAKRQIGELSGGQQQRLFIARALVQNAEIFLLDEPFAGVDVTTEKAIMELLKGQKKQGKTVLIIHHDLSSVEEYFEWVVLLNTRLIGCGPTAEIFHRENLNLVFGKGQTLFDEAASSLLKSKSGIL
ncbi:MAG TPA: metal ABC transporter ATP-binding protein [Chlamydiales bacterium]|nr:metal ABC transporter ATP-binding protein [Chlamydiales bacterium]